MMEDVISKTVANLTEKAVVTTATVVNDRIKSAKRNEQKDATINELEELIQDLLSIKNDLLRAINIYEDEFVAQKIGKDDLANVKNSIIPAIKTFAVSIKPYIKDGFDIEQLNGILDSFAPLLSYDVLNLLQTLGFNYKEAIGKPLTDKVKHIVNKEIPKGESDEVKVSFYNLQTKFIELAKDEQALQRYKDLNGTN